METFFSNKKRPRGAPHPLWTGDKEPDIQLAEEIAGKVAIHC